MSQRDAINKRLESETRVLMTVGSLSLGPHLRSQVYNEVLHKISALQRMIVDVDDEIRLEQQKDKQSAVPSQEQTPTNVTSAVEGTMALAAERMKTSGMFNLVGRRLLKKDIYKCKRRKRAKAKAKATPASENKKAVKIMHAIPTKKLKEMVLKK